MRSDLLLNITGHANDMPRDRFGRIILPGPHDNILMKLAKEEKKGNLDMSSLTAAEFDLSEQLFLLAFKKLDREGWIEGAVFELDDRGMPISVDLTNARLTDSGREYEKRLG